jgi:phosphopantothenoylcysteine synthetase/decarboxylase
MTLVVCGAPLASRTPGLASHLISAGWRPDVVASPAALEWLGGDAVERITGQPVRTTFRSPSQPKLNREPSAVVVCPATFNTINKVAVGIADNFALARICEAFGAAAPLIVVPMVNDRLWLHPAWARSLAVFEAAGATLLDIHTGQAGTRPVASGTGGSAVAAFDPQWISAALPQR